MCARKIYVGLIFCFCLKVSFAAVTVGKCKPDKHPYNTISDAIAASHSGGEVDVCPGTYAEQLQIDKPLTIEGVNGTPTIVSPSEGLNELPAGSGFYPQVLVNSAGGEVRLVNLAIDGTDAQFNVGGVVLGLDAYCPEGAVQNFVGVYFVNTPGRLEKVNVSGQFGESFPGGFSEPQLIPNCGSGIEFHGSKHAVVRDTAVSGVGQYAILSDGELMAEHNVVSGGDGPFGVGIGAVTGDITKNTVTGTLNFEKTVGIQGGRRVSDNTVQTSIYGITGADTAMHNKLQNNAISLSDISNVQNNGVSAPSTYFDPKCFYGACNGTDTGPAFATVGVDLGCDKSGQLNQNSLQGVGIGFANVPKGEKIPKTNTLKNVQTASTSCSQ